MTSKRIGLAMGVAGALLARGHTVQASATDVLIGLNSKVVHGPEGQKLVQPGTDAVLVMDVSDPAHPGSMRAMVR